MLKTCTKCEVTYPFHLFESEVCELCTAESETDDIDVEGFTYYVEKVESEPNIYKMRKCPSCRTKQPVDFFINTRRCGLCIKLKRCSHCGLDKDPKGFKASRCADCIEFKKTHKFCSVCKNMRQAEYFIYPNRCRYCPKLEDRDFPEIGLRYCNVCTTLKPEEEFPWIQSENKYRRNCLDCKRAEDRAYSKANVAKRNKAYADWIAREKLLPIRDSQHGSQIGYVIKQCRCNACIDYYEVKLKPFLRAAWHRRRHKAISTLTQEDIELSVAYRQAIRNDMCYFCGVNPGEEDEHWIAISNGGTDHWYNLSRACMPCNRGPGGKHSKSPEDFYLEKLERNEPINPRFAARILQESQSEFDTCAD